MKEVETETGNALKMRPDTLYGTIKRLLDAGLVEESGELTDRQLGDERRRYYRLPPQGRRAAEEESKRLEVLVRSAKSKSLLPVARRKGYPLREKADRDTAQFPLR